MSITTIWQAVLTVALAAVSVTAFSTETNTNDSLSGDMLLLDSIGRVVKMPTNEAPSELQPSAAIGLERQIPNPTPGSSMPPELLERLRRNTNGFQFFSVAPPHLMPYLASQDEYGNTAILWPWPTWLQHLLQSEVGELESPACQSKWSSSGLASLWSKRSNLYSPFSLAMVVEKL
jgi:hypothetical protein